MFERTALTAKRIELKKFFVSESRFCIFAYFQVEVFLWNKTKETVLPFWK